MRRILLITTSYPDQGEGEAAAGTFVRDFAIALVEGGMEVQVVAPSLSSTLTSESGVAVTRFAVTKLPLSLLNPKAPRDWTAILTTILAGQNAVLQACERCTPDHILALWALPSGAWAKRAGERYNIPYSTWALGSDIWSLRKAPVIRHYLGKVMQHAKHRFADGLQLSKDVTDICGEECEFLPSSRSFGPTSPREINGQPPYRLAFLGRWHPNKGVDIFIDSLRGLSPQDWERISAIRVHGGGPLEAKVTQQCAALRNSGLPVEIGGYLDQQGARELLNWADFIVIPSRIESIPVIFTDAMQACRPVIATPVGDLPHLIHSYQCGVLATEVDTLSLTSAIVHALNSSPTKFLAGVAEAASNFNVAATAQVFLKTISG